MDMGKLRDTRWYRQSVFILDSAELNSVIQKATIHHHHHFSEGLGMFPVP